MDWIILIHPRLSKILHDDGKPLWLFGRKHFFPAQSYLYCFITLVLNTLLLIFSIKLIKFYFSPNISQSDRCGGVWNTRRRRKNSAKCCPIHFFDKLEKTVPNLRFYLSGKYLRSRYSHQLTIICLTHFIFIEPFEIIPLPTEHTLRE